MNTYPLLELDGDIEQQFLLNRPTVIDFTIYQSDMQIHFAIRIVTEQTNVSTEDAIKALRICRNKIDIAIKLLLSQ